MTKQYPALRNDELKPGVLCTMLGRKRRKLRQRYSGELVMAPVAIPVEGETPLKGWPLRVKYFESGVPYVVMEILDHPGRPHGLPPMTKLDTRKVELCRVSSEYVRQFLGIPYKTTL